MCTGNFVDGTDLWGTPYSGGVADCGPSDKIEITVAPLAGPPAGQAWHFHGHVQGNAIDPIAEGKARVVAFQTAPGAPQRFLGGVFGQGRLPAHPLDHVHGPCAVPPNQLTKGLPIALLRK